MSEPIDTGKTHDWQDAYAELEAECARLAAELSDLSYYRDHKNCLEETVRECGRLRAALEFYAQKTDLYGEKSNQYSSDAENYKILADSGTVARKALEGKNE